MTYFSKPAKIIILLIVAASLVTPRLGGAITIKEEEELGRKFMGYLLRRLPFIEDPIITDYVDKLGRKVLDALPPQPFKYHFYVVNQDVYNAFAIPGGYIFINSGLIEAMKHEDELAGILGHEIAHVVCRHISNRIEQSKKMSWASLAGVAASIFLGAAGESEAAGAVMQGTQAAAQTAMLANSREDEIQADQIGLYLSTEAGYDPEGLLRILREMRKKNWFGSVIPDYMSTHPATDDRIVYISNWVKDPEKKPPRPAHIDPYQFNLVRLRVTALYKDAEIAEKQLQAELRKTPDDPLANYSYGLVQVRLDNPDAAIRHFKTALGKKAFDYNILRDLGWTYFQSGQVETALETLKSAANLAPDDTETNFFMGRVYLQLGNLDDAQTAFEKATRGKPVYKEALYYLGETYGKQGNMADAHYYLGFYNLYKFDQKAGVFHLKRALEKSNDPERIDEIKKILKKIETANKKK